VNVYVESNFVLELALQQEQHESCERLLLLASAGSVILLAPAFSLAEPHDALIGKDKPRQKLGNELKSHLNELERSERYRPLPDAFRDLAKTLLAAGAIERDGLKGTLDQILIAARIIPLDSDIFESARELQEKLGLPAKDSIVLASVQSHLENTLPTESCFLNRNTKDFDSPRVREMLEIYGCKFFGSFDDGLRYIEARLLRVQDPR
jgi:predicted nucleic acid-binding protein